MSPLTLNAVCGRYFRLEDRPEIVERMQVRHLAPQVRERLASHEVAPATDQPVIRHMHSSSNPRVVADAMGHGAGSLR